MSKPPEFIWDEEAQAGYLYIKHDVEPGGVARTVPADNRVLLDFDADGRIVGVEVLSCFSASHPRPSSPG